MLCIFFSLEKKNKSNKKTSSFDKKTREIKSPSLKKKNDYQLFRQRIVD